MWQKAREIMRRLSLADRFRLASFTVLILGLVGIGAWVQRQVEDGIIHGTASTTALYVESFVVPQLTELAANQPISQEHLRALAMLLHDTPLGMQLVAFKLWGPNGFVLYDTDKSSIGQTFPVEPRLQQAWSGETTSRVSDLDSPENAGERPLARQLIETYTPVRARNTDRIIAVAEFYQRADGILADIAAAQRMSWVVVAAAMILIYLLLSGFVGRASNTIQGQQAALTTQVARLKELLAQNEELHERVRAGAARTAAINERILRRISAELHDGPAQDLSLALLQIDPGGDGGALQPVEVRRSDGCDERLLPIRDAVQHALLEIRAISSGLGLPELARVTLPEVISRATRAHERRTGSRVVVRLDGLPSQAPLAIKITTYRLIQEALNNSYRHAGGAGQEVRARADKEQLTVEVSDRGPGFNVAETIEGEQHLGLLGMRERVQSLGGEFRVESVPQRGTVVSACLALTGAERIYDT